MANLFSPVQNKVLKVLGNRSMKLTRLAELVYLNSEKPLRPATAIRSAIQYINWKCERDKLNWKIISEGMGRNGATVKRVRHQWV